MSEVASTGVSGSWEEISAGIWNRPLITVDAIAGDRYYDWRKGRGREYVERLLRWADPTPEVPMTLVMLGFKGKLSPGSLKRLKKVRYKNLTFLRVTHHKPSGTLVAGKGGEYCRNNTPPARLACQTHSEVFYKTGDFGYLRTGK